MEKWLIVGLCQGIYKISLNYTVIPKNKYSKSTIMGEYQRDSGVKLMFLMTGAGTLLVTK